MTKIEIMKKAYVERDISWMYFNQDRKSVV